MLKTVIVDNNVHDSRLLQAALKKYCASNVDIACLSTSVSGAFRVISSLKPDLVFLETEIGAATGFDLLSKFHDIFFKFIFVTAGNQYATRAIKFGALDYILKPAAIDELVTAVQKAAVHGRQPQTKPAGPPPLQPQVPASRKIAIPVSNGYTMLAIQDIMYCAASREYTYIYTAHSPVICSSLNLGEYEAMLPGYAFCRVHHSYLVNKDYVSQYVKSNGGELVVDKDTLIPVSRRRREGVLGWLLGR
jgi:two-component system, LytTR family, response regulator